MAARGNVEINHDECKGCGLCVESCPPKVLRLEPELNQYGVHAAESLCRDVGIRRCGELDRRQSGGRAQPGTADA